MKEVKREVGMVKSALICFAAMAVLSSHAVAQQDDELPPPEQMRAEAEFSLMKVFQQLEKDKIRDVNPKEKKRDRKNTIGRYTTNRDFQKALGWMNELETAGQISFSKGSEKPSVSDVISDMKSYKFVSSECSKIFVYQIVHAYNQQLDLYFDKDSGKVAKIAKLLARAYNDLADMESGDTGYFSRYRTQEANEWRRMLENAADYYKLYCKAE